MEPGALVLRRCFSQVFLVTGSSSGMGWYCAKTLAENGGHVIMAARSLERTQKAAQMIKVCSSLKSTLQAKCYIACRTVLLLMSVVYIARHLLALRIAHSVQDSGARGKVEAMHLDLSSFRQGHTHLHPMQCQRVPFVILLMGMKQTLLKDACCAASLARIRTFARRWMISLP